MSLLERISFLNFPKFNEDVLKLHNCFENDSGDVQKFTHRKYKLKKRQGKKRLKQKRQTGRKPYTEEYMEVVKLVCLHFSTSFV